jgi:V8-like Glu-specific endopeptidase
VVAKYNIVRRGHEAASLKVKITYKMLKDAEVDSSNPESEHRYEHCSSWSKPSSESHSWSYEGACNNCLAEVERRHGVDWKVTDVEFEDKGRTTKTSTDWTGRRKWKCTHCVVARYRIVRRGHESSESAEHTGPGDKKAAPAVKKATPLDNKASPTDTKRTIKETGNRIQKTPHQSWKYGAEDEVFVFSAIGTRPKVAIPTIDDVAKRQEYERLAKLPRIESLFFPIPESVCLPDERQQVTTTSDAPWSANCQLVITIRDGRQAIGTGWLLGPRLVVTAGHCVHEGENGEFFEKVEVIPGMNGPVRPFGSLTASQANLRASQEWKESGTLAMDYGAIILDEDFTAGGSSPANLAIAVKSNTQLTNLPVFLSGYPADKLFGTQWRDDDPILTVQEGRLKYMLDTFGGHSGSAVVSADDKLVVGIHNYGGCPNHCTRITSKVKADLDAWSGESQR